MLEKKPAKDFECRRIAIDKPRLPRMHVPGELPHAIVTHRECVADTDLAKLVIKPLSPTPSGNISVGSPDRCHWFAWTHAPPTEKHPTGGLRHLPIVFV